MATQIFFIFTRIPGEIIQFDLRICFQMGWFNHQLVIALIFVISFNHKNQPFRGSVNIPAPWRGPDLWESPYFLPRLGPQNDISGLLGAGGKITCGKTLMFFWTLFVWGGRFLELPESWGFYHVSTLEPESQVVFLNWKKYREDLDIVKAPQFVHGDLESSKLIRVKQFE